MDWDLAIKRNSEALKGIVEALFAMLGLAGTEMAARIPQPLHRAVLRVLRPAESAARRLIFLAARGLVVKPAVSRPRLAGPMVKGVKTDLPPRASSFQLFDPRKRFVAPRYVAFKRSSPRIHIITADDPHLVPRWLRPQAVAQPSASPTSASPAASDGQVKARRLVRRLEALKLALEDLPRQARRLARWRLRQETAQSPSFRRPLRLGHPPGHRKRTTHEVDDILSECHVLACQAMSLDTS